MKAKIIVLVCLVAQIKDTIGQIEWKAASDGEVPLKALVAGKEGRDKLYLCRAWHETEIVPGKLNKRSRGCVVPFAGKTHKKSIYSVAVGNGEWVTNEQNTSYFYAATAGFNRRYQDVSICRGNIEGNVIPGKIDGLECHLPFSGIEHKPPVYEYLKTMDPRTQWVKRANGNHPESAIVTGRDDDDNLYSCRAWAERNLFPGKLHPRNENCYIPLEGKEYKVSIYDVLVGSSGLLGWAKARDGDRPPRAVVAGISRYFQDQYICRGDYIGKLLPGHLDSHGCVVPYEDSDHLLTSYEVLVHI